MNDDFANVVTRWVQDAKEAEDFVVRTATHDLLFHAQRLEGEGGSMPFKTGFLRGSLSVAIRTTPKIVTTIRSGYEWVPVVRRLRAGQRFLARWTAPYANAQEYGYNGIPGKGFQRKAVQLWLVFVRDAEMLLARVRR